jgi:hypothetical protein
VASMVEARSADGHAVVEEKGERVQGESRFACQERCCVPGEMVIGSFIDVIMTAWRG